MPHICVAIVAYQSDKTLPRCLAALDGQSFRDFETVIVHNGLTDCLGHLPDYAMKLRVVTPSSNLGFAAGNNLAAAKASVDTVWLALLNPDAYPEPDWLASFVAAARGYPNTNMFGSLQIDAENAKICDGRGDAYHPFGLAWRRGHGWPVPDGLKDCQAFSPCGAAAFYQLAAFQQVGGFDESFFCYLEDVDLGFRLRLAGGDCIQLANVKIQHLGGASSTSAFAVLHASRNQIRTYLKNTPSFMVWLLLPGFIACLFTFALRYAAAGHGQVVWQGIKDGFKDLPHIWRQRRSIQKTRKASIGRVMQAMTWLPVEPMRHLLRPRTRNYFSDSAGAAPRGKGV